MNQLNPTSSVETLVDGYGWCAVTRLDGNPDLAACAADARNMIDDLDQLQNNHRLALRAVMSAASVRETRKYQLDSAMRYAHIAVLIWVHGRRASTYYKSVFSNGLAGVIRANAEEEIHLARDIVTKLTGFQVPELAPAIEGLQAAMAALEAAVDAHADALRGRKEAWSVVQGGKIAFCRRYYGLYCQVVQILGDPALAQTYFRRAQRSQPAPEDVPESDALPPALPGTVPFAGPAPAGTNLPADTEVEPAHAA